MVFAQNASDASKAVPCASLIKSCQTAGYTENGTAGKEVWANCIGPALSNQSVPNFKPDPSQVASCTKELKSLPCAKIAEACRTGGYIGGPKKLPMFDCMLPLVQGRSVPGVRFNPADLSTCKTTMEMQIKNQPCLRVMIACKGAGYSPDEVNGQAFVRNCYIPLLNGERVVGVSIDDATAQACKLETTKSGAKINQTP
jgi:hypothetical protein